EGQLARLEPPLAQTFVAHAAVAAFVVAPAGGIQDELPAQPASKGAQDGAGGLHRPDLVEVAERAAHLELDTLAIREAWVEIIGPVEPAVVEAAIARGGLGHGELA